LTDRALELLSEYVLGLLGPAELALVDRALVTSAPLRLEADRLTEALLAGLLPGMPAAAPSAQARARLMAALATEP
jgi:hypothetical protein